MARTEAFIIDAQRTPVGKYGGVLRDVRPDDLSAIPIKALLGRNSIDPASIQDLMWGCANQAGEDNRNVGRMAALLAGLPYSVPGTTINRLCGSSLDAINHAARAIWSDDLEIIVAGGVESMSRAPYSVPKNQSGSFGNVTAYDTALGWRYPNKKLEKLFPLEAMGETAENIAEQYKISREEQDKFALESHRRAVEAQHEGKFEKEIVPVEIPARAKVRIMNYHYLPESSKLSPEDMELRRRYEERFPPRVDDEPRPELRMVDDKVFGVIRADEGPRRDTDLEQLAKLQPAFRKGGTVTAGNSSSLNDGAAAVLMMNAKRMKEAGLEPMARIVATGVAGVDPRFMGLGPVPAVQQALSKARLTMKQIDLVELNEAFAAQSIAVIRELGIDTEKMNVNGGAIALGHPLGCSGARIMTTLLHELQRRKARYGIATMCIGVGQGIATIIESV